MKIMRRNALRLLGFIFCSPELLPAKTAQRFPTRQKTALQSFDANSKGGPDSKDEESAFEKKEYSPATTKQEDTSSFVFVKGMEYSSVLFDLFDLVKAVLDLVLAVRLSKLEDSKTYAVVLLCGIVLGRIVIFRGTWLFFRGGIQLGTELEGVFTQRCSWSQKSLLTLQLLYCLAHTEVAAFLFENFPALIIYAFWMVVNFPPVPLEMIDDINVIVSVVLGLSLALILAILSTSCTVYQGFMQLTDDSGTWRSKTYQIGRMIGFAFLASIVAGVFWQVVSLAWNIAVLDRREIPPGDLLWGFISICDDPASFQERDTFCDEPAILVRIMLAWLLAGYFSFYLFFRPAPFEDKQPGNGGDDDDKDDGASVSDGV